MNRHETTLLIIPDTSNGSKCLILPETHKRYNRLIASLLRRQLKTKQDWEILGRGLITISQYAHDARHIHVLREVSDFLVSLPVRKELQAIGVYYQAQVLHRTGEIGAARDICEKLATQSHFPWKPKAIATVGTCYFDSGDLDSATAFYLEALSSTAENGRDVRTWFISQCMIGRIRSRQGDNHNGLALLESSYPVAHYIGKFHPATYYDYLNSLAVRHTALGHFSEAEQLCEVTLSSPFARNFPNWAETREEIFAAKDAAAATVYVNIEPTPESKQDVIEQVFKPCELATGPKIRVAINERRLCLRRPALPGSSCTID
jgi:hypothetical protein